MRQSALEARLIVTITAAFDTSTKHIGEVIDSAQTSSGLASIVDRKFMSWQFKAEFQMTSKMLSSARQKFAYFRVIAIVLIVVAALFWGLAHI